VNGKTTFGIPVWQREEFQGCVKVKHVGRIFISDILEAGMLYWRI